MVSQENGNPARRKILAAAEVEFATKGFDGARVDAVAARAGVNKALLYYYFSGKTGILDALFEEFFRELRAAQDEAVIAAENTAERGDAQTRAAFAVMARRSDLLRIVLLEELKGDGQSRILAQWRSHWEGATGGPGARPHEQALFGFFFEDLPVVLFQLLKEPWCRTMGQDPQTTDRLFFDLARSRSEDYWRIHGAV